MSRIFLALGILAVILPAKANSLDLNLPFNLNFKLGFDISVVPSPRDTSAALGLVVDTNKIYSDKTRSLVVIGTITNSGPLPCHDVAMHFDVTSHVGTG